MSSGLRSSGAASAEFGSQSGCENKGQHILGSSADHSAKAAQTVCQPEEGILLQIKIKKSCQRTLTLSLNPGVEGKAADVLCSKPAKIKSEELILFPAVTTRLLQPQTSRDLSVYR